MRSSIALRLPMAEEPEPTNEPEPKNTVEAEGNSAENRRKANLVKAGLGIGIGSAAIVAALLFTNHAKKKKVD